MSAPSFVYISKHKYFSIDFDLVEKSGITPAWVDACDVTLELTFLISAF